MNGEQGVSIGWIKDMIHKLLERHILAIGNGSSKETRIQGASKEIVLTHHCRRLIQVI